MSLLLDALKKAAQEKQRASSIETGSVEAGSIETGSVEAGSIETGSADTASEATGFNQNNVEINSNKNDVELSLDEMETSEQPSPPTTEPERQTAEELSVEPELELEKTSATTATVSDEALQLLVYKTNKQYRRSQKLIWGGALIAALVLLLLGGVYYYSIMVEEVEALELKHRIAMRAFESHQLPPSPKKPSYMEAPAQRAQVVTANNTSKGKVTAPQIKRAITQKQRSSDTFSVQRTQKRDPVSSLLNKAWLAYGDKNYAVATDTYKQVLAREPRNRDALLGKAAIAIKQGDYVQARRVYKQLLRLDPRDQIAMSALSNLEEVAPDADGESRLKFMLQQQPNAAHLHFALGNYYAKQIKWPEAQSEYFSAWQGDSNNADYAFNLAVSLDQLGKQKDAARFYEKSLSLSSGKNISFSVESVKQRLDKLQRGSQ